MSNFSKRKRLVDQFLGQEIETLTDKQSFVKVVRSKGNNLHEVLSADGETYLMSMPTKFRNVAYVKAGDYVLVEAIDEGDKVRAEMVNLVLPNQIPDYIKRGIWPDRFKDAVKSKQESEYIPNDDFEDELFRNLNRVGSYNLSDSEDSNESDPED